MHLVAGFLRVMLASSLAAVYRGIRWDAIGLQIVRLSCSAFTAGAGLDDAALDVVRGMGRDGIRLLRVESERRGGRGIAPLMLKMLGAAGDA